jgi:hypothetical protein
VGDLTGLSGNLSADPMFVNTASRYLHVEMGSPAIRRGIVRRRARLRLRGYGKDLKMAMETEPRRNDIGAYEMSDGTTPARVSLIDVHADALWRESPVVGARSCAAGRHGSSGPSGENWATIGTAVSLNDEVDFRDSDVQPGHEYGYRLTGISGNSTVRGRARPGFLNRVQENLRSRRQIRCFGARPTLLITLPSCGTGQPCRDGRRRQTL